MTTCGWTMRYLMILFAALVLASPASADITICNEYESGPEMAKLSEICDLLGSDPDVNRPLLSPTECQRRLTIMGALWYNATRQKADLKLQMRADLRALENDARVALPMPAPGPPTTPTPTATSTP